MPTRAMKARNAMRAPRVRATRRRTALLATGLAAGLALAVGGCTASNTGGDSARTDSKPGGSGSPSRALVVWVDTMCETTSALAATQKSSAQTIEEITHPMDDPVFRQESGYGAQSYLSQMSTSLNTVARGFAGLDPSGIAEADHLRAVQAKGVDGIRPEVTKLADFMTVGNLPAAEKVSRAQRVAKLVASLKAPHPDLPDLVAKNAKLAAAYDLAPRCAHRPGAPAPARTPAPTAGGLPAAADGTDTSACEDGACQILITSKPVDFTVGTLKVTASVENGSVRLHHAQPSGGSGSMTFGGQGGRGTIGNGTGTVTVRIAALKPDSAILDITSSS
ncbi:hypothetical protein [Streptomyces sp. NPDC088725]|uniref:hypothetical protein n=1 Tax=Streptomyces sp. NPDC088725 TaxID=3365873 RepID=UPI00380AE0F0